MTTRHATGRTPIDSRADPELLTDPQGADLLQMGDTKFSEIQKRPDFPKPVWLGPRGKRHVRSELLTWALAQRDRPSCDSSPPPLHFDGKARQAAARLGCRLVRDLSPDELAAWTAAGKPQRVKLGEYELVPLKALQRLTVPAASTIKEV